MIQYPEKYKFDHVQFSALNDRFEQLIYGDMEYAKESPIEKLLFSILTDTASKFVINGFARPKKTYTVTLKYYQAFALLTYVTYLLQFENDIYWRTILDQIRIMLDKKVQ